MSANFDFKVLSCAQRIKPQNFESANINFTGKWEMKALRDITSNSKKRAVENGYTGLDRLICRTISLQEEIDNKNWALDIYKRLVEEARNYTFKQLQVFGGRIPEGKKVIVEITPMLDRGYEIQTILKYWIK
jgi:hypothetical protein